MLILLVKHFMRGTLKRLILGIFAFIFIITTTTFGSNIKVFAASENDYTILTKKVSKAYTKKFCNAIAFGLSKESAMKFSIEENKQVFKKRKDINNINKELLAEDIAISVIEECGYPINLSGEKGIKEFKIYYLSMDKDSERQ
tara:strand:+ start:1068 stop:1496 length:429 start_codon:yes stop_codon:yes gene_type:complete